MSLHNVIILQKECSIAQELAWQLSEHGFQPLVTASASEVKTALAAQKVEAAILALDIVDPAVVAWITNTASDVTVICTHHAPDDDAWVTALLAGATDLCHPSESKAILKSLHSRRGARHTQHEQEQ